ncbi:MAG: transposase [Deltaproteobacteria bacterium]|nr:transposase [Deltaproteobacteria bacterium]
MTLTTWKFRVKDSGSAGRRLTAMARSVNFVWNYAKETQVTALRRSSTKVILRKDGMSRTVPNFFSAFELNNLVAGSAKDLGLHSQTVQAVVEEYARRRAQFRKLLRWRGRKSLGWIPFKASGVRLSFDAVREWTGATSGKRRSKARGNVTYCGLQLEFWASRVLPDDAVIKTGSFGQNALGQWFVSITFASDQLTYATTDEAVGIDIGIKSMATLSSGGKLTGPGLRERYLDKIRRLERTRLSARRRQAASKCYGRLPKARRVAKLHAKTAHARSDYLHKASTSLVESYGQIFIGDVPCRLMNRSKNLAGISLDHGIGKFKQQVSYKAQRAGGQAQEIKERDSTRTCAICLEVYPRIGLGKREWKCSKCGRVHDRDVNAARNILRLGREALTHLHCREAVQA